MAIVKFFLLIILIFQAHSKLIQLNNQFVIRIIRSLIQRINYQNQADLCQS